MLCEPLKNSQSLLDWTLPSSSQRQLLCWIWCCYYFVFIFQWLMGDPQNIKISKIKSSNNQNGYCYVALEYGPRDPVCARHVVIQVLLGLKLLQFGMQRGSRWEARRITFNVSTKCLGWGPVSKGPWNKFHLLHWKSVSSKRY